MDSPTHSRRTFLRAAAAAASGTWLPQSAEAQARPRLRTVRTATLEIGYEESGDPSGIPVILLHGFPDDARAWDDVAGALAAARHRVIVPYLRGYGPTRFLNSQAPRMAEQAALAQDVIDLADALGLREFAVSGYDWGGRAAAIVAALHPERVRAAVLVAGYTIQNVFAAPQPMPPDRARAFWYQWYFNTEQGRVGLERNRRALCRLLWQTWSPTWHFTDATYDATAPSFDNPDFVDCVIHSYRHRLGNAPGDPRLMEAERRLAQRPQIEVPTITLYGTDDALVPPGRDDTADRRVFTALRARRLVHGGHFLPRENPDAVSAALLELL